MVKWYENIESALNSFVVKNFQLKEFRCKCVKCDLIAIDDKLLTKLSVVREKYDKPIYLNSAYRCQEHNRSIKDSAKFSYHQRGQAVDILLPAFEDEKKELLSLLEKEFYCIEYSHKNFVHCNLKI